MFKSKKSIEEYISEVLADSQQEQALSFVSHLRASDIEIKRFTYHGKDTLHWQVKYKGELVCYILLDAEKSSWTVMPDNSATSRFADYPIDDAMKETAWQNLNICMDGQCGGCAHGTGTPKMVFGKEIAHVCGMAYNFTNPDAKALQLAIKMMDVRKGDIAKQV
ncbi:MAG: hypothetical protein FWB76_02495 [Oscillospiraceae bacterium]|nr:hypothetical protein [Oscillospiraceae bacterium]